MNNYPISEESHKKIKEAVKKALEPAQKAFDEQVEDMVKFLEEDLTWGQFRVLGEALTRFLANRKEAK